MRRARRQGTRLERDLGHIPRAGTVPYLDGYRFLVPWLLGCPTAVKHTPVQECGLKLTFRLPKDGYVNTDRQHDFGTFNLLSDDHHAQVDDCQT